MSFGNFCCGVFVRYRYSCCFVHMMIMRSNRILEIHGWRGIAYLTLNSQLSTHLSKIQVYEPSDAWFIRIAYERLYREL